MAKTQPKDLLSRFADLGEEAMHKLADVPGANRLVEMTNQSRQRLDEVQKRLRGLDALEKRVEELERRLDALAKPTARKPAARKSAAKPSSRATAAKKPATPKKPPA